MTEFIEMFLCLIFIVLFITAILLAIIYDKLKHIGISEINKEKLFKKDFLIALGWKRYNNQLWYRAANDLYDIDAAYTVALREAKKN